MCLQSDPKIFGWTIGILLIVVIGSATVITCWCCFYHTCLKPGNPWSAGDAWAPPDFGRSVNPISTRGSRLCPTNNTGTPGPTTWRYYYPDIPWALRDSIEDVKKIQKQFKDLLLKQ